MAGPTNGRRNRVGACVVLTAVTVALTAGADDPERPISNPDDSVVEPIWLEYDAPDTCPREGSFRGEIQARTPRARVSQSRDGVRAFYASIRGNPPHFVGKLRVVGPDEETSEREVTGESCAEVTSALALMTAVAVDPQASTAPLSALPLPPPVPHAPPTPAPKPSPPKPKVLPRKATESTPALQSPPSASWQGSAGLDALLMGGIAPNLSLGAMVYGELGQVRRENLASSFRIGAKLVDSGPLSGPSENASIRWIGARLEGCPVHISLGPRSLSGQPCLAFDLGGLWAEGKSIAKPQSDHRFWAALGAVTRLRWAPWNEAFFEVGASLMAPFWRDTFVFTNPRVVVHGTPIAVWSVSLGAGHRFL